MTERRRDWGHHAITALVLLLVWGFLLSHFRPSLLLLDTMPAGGDTPSFLRPISHLRQVLLPAGQPLGWDLANFAGYSPFQYYPPLPSLGIVLLSTLLPLTVAFKLMTVAGVFLLPPAVALTVGCLGFRFPMPAVGAAASLLFLFNPGNSMWGGNVPSMLAGEFSFSLAFAFSTLFIGLLYRGVERGRGWRGLGVLLAVTGLCHPVPFLTASLAGLFFLARRRTVIGNSRFLAGLYAVAAALMAFWLVPLLARLGLVTSIPWRWDFARWNELFPLILLPVVALAVIDLLWIAWRRSPEDRPAHFLLFCALAAQFCFLNAPLLGVPDIRFLPFVHLILVLLALDLVRRLLRLEADRWPATAPLRYAPHVGGLALALACLAWTGQQVTFIPSWIRWNYEGLERKPAYPLLRELMDAVAGEIDDPRVAYEHSPLHNRFGSSRVFENMALLSGRATLEGVMLQNAVTSPFVYWLQSAISKQDTRVLPGFGYPELDPGRATPRLDLFNVSDLIVVSAEVRTALAGDPRWELALDRPPYAVFRRAGGTGGYVRVPRYRPALLETDDWKRDFHRWFGRDEDLDVPLVAASAAGDRPSGFALASSLESIPHESLPGDCVIDERIDHLEIDFTTSCPGLPHWISVSYSPNWRVEGAERIFLASPAFMLVVPRSERVRLRFTRTAVDWAGLVLTAAALAGLAAYRPRRDGLPFYWLERAAGPLVRLQPIAIAALLVALAVASGRAVVTDFTPSLVYRQAWKAFDSRSWDRAHRYFEWVSRRGSRVPEVADAAFFSALSRQRAGEHEAAIGGFERVVAEFSNGHWVAESHFRIGESLVELGRPAEAVERFERLARDHPASRWAEAAAARLERMRTGDG